MKKNQISEKLNEESWSTIADPNTGVEIYNLLVDNRNRLQKIWGSITNNSIQVKEIGKLSTMFKNDNYSLPNVDNACYSTNHNDEKNQNNKLKGDISLLKTILKQTGLEIKASANFERAKKVSLSYQNPEIYKISIDKIHEYIIGATAKQTHNNYNDVKQGNIYLVYELKKTNDFSVQFYDEKNNAIELKADALNDILKTGFKINLNGNSRHQLSFKSDKKIVFAFKAAKIRYLGKAYSLTNKYEELKNTFSDTELRLLKPIQFEKFDSKESFREALPSLDNETKKDLLVELCEYDDFKLEPKDRLHHLDGEYDLEHLDKTLYVSIE